MKVAQWAQRPRGQVVPLVGDVPQRPDALLVFGPRALLEDGQLVGDLRARWPDAAMLGCTTAGGISARGVDDDDVVVTALGFDAAHVRVVEVPLAEDHFVAGRALAEAVSGPDLRAVILVVGGVHTDSQSLVDGLREVLTDDIVVAGGLAGDGQAFVRTGIISDAGYREGYAAALGIYGAVHASSTSASGWRPFGLDRTVTRAAGKVVHEIDGNRALDVYARYLGDDADLPGAGLVYPIAIVSHGREIIRSLSAIDRESGALTFFGDVPEGSVIRLMHASNAELVAGAGRAGDAARVRHGIPPELALLFSCVGRKAVLGAATALEIDAVVDALGARPVIAGFHTYGEIGPPDGACAFQHHNQTMTVLVLTEVPP